MPKVWFKSKPQRLILPQDGEPFSTEYDGVIVREQCELTPEEEPEGVGLYGVVVEGEAETQADVDHAVGAALDVAYDLDRCWIYVTGKCLIPVRRKLVIPIAPEDWTSNAEALREQLPYAGRLIHLGSEPGWGEFPMWPLRDGWEVRERYLSANETIRTLVELHYQALKTPGTEAMLILLAKALEVARAMLPGKRDSTKEAALPDDIRAALRQSLHWLFGMANNRLEVRHAVRTKSQPPELHPRMSLQERRNFVHDANLILRTVLCEFFGRQPFIIATAERPARR